MIPGDTEETVDERETKRKKGGDVDQINTQTC